MRVVCPYIAIADETRTALNSTAWQWEAVDVSGSDTAYAELLQQLWTAGQTFVLVEHDVVIRPDTLNKLVTCPQLWCAFPYQLGTSMVTGLGCTRFDAQLLRAHPHAVAQTWAEQNLVHPAGHWCNLDDRLSRVLRSLGVVPHVHGPPVTHLNPNPTHGCS